MINANFTAQMETSLDLIALGDLNWEQYLRSVEQDVITPSIATIQQLYPGSFQRQQQEDELTHYICTICSCPLKLIRYRKGKRKTPKQMLKCSGDAAHPVYFGTKSGGFWNPDGAALVENNQPVGA